ncbi:MAG: VOC family protein, partial [Gemella sp.]|nr:VOC family protein [Gemella sp.]
NFYKEVFETEFVSPIVRKKSMMPNLEGTEEGERVLYVAIEVDGHQIQGNDSPDIPTDFTKNPQAFSIFVEVETAEKAEDLFAKLSKNGNVVYPLAVQPWGDHFGHLVDQFGIKWDIKVK